MLRVIFSVLAVISFIVSAVYFYFRYIRRHRLHQVINKVVIIGDSSNSADYLTTPSKMPPQDTLCAICLGLIFDEQYGETTCCRNYLHTRCVGQYQSSGSMHSNRCCLCQKAKWDNVTVIAINDNEFHNRQRLFY